MPGVPSGGGPSVGMPGVGGTTGVFVGRRDTEPETPCGTYGHQRSDRMREVVSWLSHTSLATLGCM